MRVAQGADRQGLGCTCPRPLRVGRIDILIGRPGLELDVGVLRIAGWRNDLNERLPSEHVRVLAPWQRRCLAISDAAASPRQDNDQTCEGVWHQASPNVVEERSESSGALLKQPAAPGFEERILELQLKLAWNCNAHKNNARMRAASFDRRDSNRSQAGGRCGPG